MSQVVKLSWLVDYKHGVVGFTTWFIHLSNINFYSMHRNSKSKCKIGA